MPNALLAARGAALGQIGGAFLYQVHTLLGFQHEMPRAIGIDKARGVLVPVGKGDGPLELVMVVAVIIGGRVGAVEAPQFGQLDHEELVIGMFAATGVFPAGDEVFDYGFCSH